MSSPREAQLPLLLAISEGLSRGTNEMLRVSPQGDAIHPPSCSLAIRESVEEIKWLRAEVERLTRERDESKSKETEYREGFEEGWDAAQRGAADEIEKLTRECDEARAGIERLRKDLRQGFPIRYETAAGCLCPAGSNASCQNSFCPRRNPPGVTCGGGRS